MCRAILSVFNSFIIHENGVARLLYFLKTDRCDLRYWSRIFNSAVLGESIVRDLSYFTWQLAHTVAKWITTDVRCATSVKVFYVTSAWKKNQFRRGDPRCAAPCTDDLHTWHEGLICRTRCARHSFEFQRSSWWNLIMQFLHRRSLHFKL